MSETRDMAYPSGTNVVGGWHFDEATASDCLDWSGQGITLTPSGTTTEVCPDLDNGQVTWNFGNRRVFDATDDFCQNSVTDKSALKTQTLTIEALIFDTSMPAATGGICDMSPQGSNGTGRGFRLMHNRNNFYLQLGNGAGFTNVLFPAGGPTLVIGWNYLAATFVTGSWKLYLNGALVNTSTAAFTIEYANNPAEGADYEALVIGATKRTTGLKENFLTSKLADLRISNVVRTPAEIAAMQAWLFPEFTSTGTGTGGGTYSPLPFAPYNRYKTLRSLGNELNNLVIGP